MEDDYTVVYKYGGYDLNDPEYYNKERIKDGTIMIEKDCFVEPEIHEKLKRMPSRRKKLITKRIPVEVDYRQMIRDERIIVENCSNCWEQAEDALDADVMACHLLFKLFALYQEEGTVPDCVDYHV